MEAEAEAMKARAAEREKEVLMAREAARRRSQEERQKRQAEREELRQREKELARKRRGERPLFKKMEEQAWVYLVSLRIRTSSHLLRQLGKPLHKSMSSTKDPQEARACKVCWSNSTRR